MGRHGDWLRSPARLLVATLVSGVVVTLAPPALSGATAPIAAKSEGAKSEGGKVEDARSDAKAEGQAEPKAGDKEKAKPSVVTVGPSSKAEKAEKAEKRDKAEKKDEKDGKVAGKPEAMPEGKAQDKAASTPEAKKDDKAATGTAPAAKGAKGSKGSTTDAEPAPPTTPPIKMAALREEMSRPPRKEEQHASGTRAERERLEQLASEINKTREGLRQDTARLEALLAARDAAAQVSQGSAAAAAAGDGGDAPKKTPTPLDNLAKAIRGMKPEQAAPIISRVDRKLAADVLLRMPGGDAGKVLGVCKPEVAAEIAAEIASRTPRAELRR